MKIDLPEPDPHSLAQSNKLKLLIQQRIGKSSIRFAKFMRMCLYTKELGYYESDREIFGRQGDFVTSPEQGNFFAKAFATHIKSLSQQFDQFSIIEVGAGSGQFAVDMIHALNEIDCRPSCYYIVETSSALKRRQQELLKNELSESKLAINWVETLAKPIEVGIVIGNEVLDAFPVDLVSVQGEQVKERCVSLEAEQEFVFVEENANKEIINLVKSRLPKERFTASKLPYQTEINSQLDSFVSRMATLVEKGIFFFIDYGYPQAEYYHEQRSMGTLLCHYQHIAHDDPLRWPGLQDITASVDFTALANAALQHDLSVDCYCTQAHFLMASKAFTDLGNIDISSSSEIKKLFLPGEMGERFQVMMLSKGVEMDGINIAMRDLRHRL